MPLSMVNDERLHLLDHNKPVVIYSYWAIVTITLTGLAAFGAIGFLGYTSDGQLFYPLAHPVWFIFLWFSVVMVLIQAMIFRDKKWVNEARNAEEQAFRDAEDKVVRHWKWKTIIVTLFCIGCGIVVYVKPAIVTELLNNLLHTPGTQSASEVVLWNVVNFLPLFLYLGDRTWLWVTGERVRFAGELAEWRSLQYKESHIPATFWQLDKWEMALQDFFGGAALALALSVLLQANVLNGFLSILPLQSTGIHVDQCAVTLAIGACQNGAAHNPPALARIDLSAGLIFLFINLVILVAHLVPRVLTLLAREAARTVAEAVGKTLLTIFNPLDVFLRTIRVVIWPAFIAAGILLAAISAHFLRLYLHLLSDKRTCVGPNLCGDLREFGSYLSNSLDPISFQSHALTLQATFLGAALVTGAAAMLAILISAQVLVLGRVVKPWLMSNWLKFIAILGLIIICFYWLLSIILSVFMYILQSFAITPRTPFPQPGLTMIFSLAIFLVLFIGSLPPFHASWIRDLWGAMFSFLRSPKPPEI